MQAQHPEVVLGLALVELLLCGAADPRPREHEDAGPRAVDAGPPRPFGVRHVSALVELGGVLAEVPDVALLVLAVPLGRALAEMAAQIEPVLDDDARDAVDLLRPMGDDDDVAGGMTVLAPSVHVRRAGVEREPGVVDPGAEVGRLRHRRGRGVRCRCENGAARHRGECQAILVGIRGGCSPDPGSTNR